MAIQKQNSFKRKCVRKRSGCLICKKRKKKCDEGKPKCQACARLGLQCSYEKILTWYDANQHHLEMAKDSGAILQKITSENFHFINFNFNDISLSSAFTNGINYFITSDVHNIDQDENKSLLAKSFSQINFKNLYNNSEVSFINFRTNTNIENHLFEYYVSVLSKRRAFSDSSNNEYRTLIIPNCYISPALFHSVIALAANDMVRKQPQHSKYYSSLSTKYKNEAITILHNILDNEPHFLSSDSSDLLNEIIVTILMLCSLEISDKGNKNWLNHLREGGLIFGSLSYSKILNSGMLLFSYRYFTLRYILLLTTLNHDELQKFLEASPWPIISNFFDNDKVDYMLGCSPSLLKIIYKITVLNYNRFSMTENEFRQEYAHLEDELTNLNQQLNNNDKNSLELKLCAQAYYESTKIYLRYSLFIFSGMELAPSDFEKLMNTVLSVLNRLISEVKHLSLFPTWTIFIAASCSSNLLNDAVRFSILNNFEELEKVWPQASNSQIRVAIETIWKTYDLNFDLINHYSSCEAGLIDWRDILSITGFKLALT